ncbi:hypothetical protein FH972_024277 [Carpinus fangiana]|uniref:Ubiquitin-like domain-containing protein n=1 Tax=Carpinus fangiana TaxID=176857 RepID=A0A5N6KY15_9ROSI|nr:hypothetical protein FH972_024277 [Carpinus fangiana]
MDERPPALPPRRNPAITEVTAEPSGNEPTKVTRERIEIPDRANGAVEDKDANGSIDSGYGSLADTPGDVKRTASFQGEEVVLGDPGLFGRKPKKMRRFRMPISEAHRSRYTDLEETFCRGLEKLLSKKKKKHVKPLDIGLVVLGQTESCARPCILVTCNKLVVRYVTTFFDQSWVGEELNPTSGDGFPSFDLYIKSMPCKPKAAGPVEVFERQADKNYLEVITNGYPVFAQTPYGWKRSTIGGFIDVKKTIGPVETYGLTAGHLITPWDESDDESGTESEEDDDDSRTVTDNEEDEWDIDLEDTRFDDEDKLPEAQSAATDRSYTFEVPDIMDLAVLGHGFELVSSAMGCKSLDYALLTVQDMARCFNSRPLREQPTEHKFDEARSVTLLNAMGIGLAGNLSMSLSSLLLSQKAGFVKTFKLELLDGYGVTDGDSGAWVVDTESDVVYGHVVAVDLFGDAHVVPLERVLSDMRLGFDAVEVKLAEAGPPREVESIASNIAPNSTSARFHGSYSFPDSGYATREASKNSTVETLQPQPGPSWDSGSVSIGTYNPPYYQPGSGVDSAYVSQNASPEEQNTLRNQTRAAQAKAAQYGIPSRIAAGGGPGPNPAIPRPDDLAYGNSQGHSYGAYAPLARTSSVSQQYSAPKYDQTQLPYVAELQSNSPNPYVATYDVSGSDKANQFELGAMRKELVQLEGKVKSQEEELQYLRKALAETRTSLEGYHGHAHERTRDYEADHESYLEPLSDSTNVNLARATRKVSRSREQIAEAEANLETALVERRRLQNRIQVIDPMGIKYALPLEHVQTWKSLSLPDETMYKQIQDQQFDLISSEGEVIPRQCWAELIEPGFTVVMNLWQHRSGPLRYVPTLSGDVFGLGHILGQFSSDPISLLMEASRTIPNNGLLRARGPILMKSRLFPTSPKALADILNHRCYDFEKPRCDRDFLRRPIGNGLVVAEGSDHKLQRKSVWPAFRGDQMKGLVPIFWSKSIEFVDVVARKKCQSLLESSDKTSGCVELGAIVSRVTLDIIGAAGLGYNFNTLHNSGDELAKVYASLTDPSNPVIAKNYIAHFLLPTAVAQRLPFVGNSLINKSSLRLRGICKQLIIDKKHAFDQNSKEQKNETILSLLLHSNAFSDDAIVDQLLTFLAAGHETTSSALEWALYMLAKHQDVQQRLREEVKAHVGLLSYKMDSDKLDQMQYLNAVCMEVLRYWPTVPISTRTAICDTVIADTFVPKGTDIDMVPMLLNKSTDLWGPDAGEFNPDRWLKKSDGGSSSLYSFMTFIHGPRSCIGQGFAKAELKCLLAAFMLQFQFEMENPNEVIIPAGIVTVKPKYGLHLRLRNMASTI